MTRSDADYAILQTNLHRHQVDAIDAQVVRAGFDIRDFGWERSDGSSSGILGATASGLVHAPTRSSLHFVAARGWPGWYHAWGYVTPGSALGDRGTARPWPSALVLAAEWLRTLSSHLAPTPPGMSKPTVLDLERGHARFDSLVRDLAAASHRTWEGRLRALVHECQTIPVLYEVLRELEGVPVDPTAWLAALNKDAGAVMGSGNIVFPTDGTARLALLWALLTRVAAGSIKPYQLLFSVSPAPQHDDKVRDFGEVIVRPFATEMRTRLDERKATARAQEIGAVPLTGASIGTLIYNSGHMEGVALASHGGQVTQTMTSGGDALVEAVREWRSLLTEVEASRREEVRQALSLVERSLATGEGSIAEVSSATRSLAAAGPSFRAAIGKFLTDVASNAAGSVLAPHVVPVLTMLQMALHGIAP
jgi:hypothetical protein